MERLYPDVVLYKVCRYSDTVVLYALDYQGKCFGVLRTIVREKDHLPMPKENSSSVSLETFWLSPTPYVPGSRYPVQSMCPRTATDVVFEDMETGKVFRVINTHLDHECAGARKLGLEQILAHLRAEKAFADVPVILSGDFNAEPDSEEMKPLRETAGLVNATEGIGITFHNYHRDDPNDPQCSIDYIILKGDWELKKVEKWTEQKDGVCLSDHYPICAELI